MRGYEPTTEAELEQALQAGNIEEDHFTDLKVKLEPGPRANHEIAVDIAAFSIDGGQIYIGVDEDTAPPSLNPILLSGLPERIEQVALSRVDEPVHVRCSPIPSTADASAGYVIVTVPPSPSAPHMVAQKYRGRGDKTNTILSDAEVVRLHTLRLRRERTAADLLEVEIGRDPYPSLNEGRLYIVATPVTGRRRMAHDGADGGLDAWMRTILVPALAGAPVLAPDYDINSGVSRRGAGACAIHSPAITADRRYVFGADGKPQSPHNALDLEVTEDGVIHFYCSRGVTPDSRGQPTVIERLIVGHIRKVLTAVVLCSAAASYLGSWDVGVAVTRLRGAHSWELAQTWDYPIEVVTYGGDDYRETIRLTLERLKVDRDGIVRDLYSPLSRGLHSNLDLAMG
jgi:hypothetical protein